MWKQEMATSKIWKWEEVVLSLTLLYIYELKMIHGYPQQTAFNMEGG